MEETASGRDSQSLSRKTSANSKKGKSLLISLCQREKTANFLNINKAVVLVSIAAVEYANDKKCRDLILGIFYHSQPQRMLRPD
jgi:hypothetical protein